MRPLLLLVGYFFTLWHPYQSSVFLSFSSCSDDELYGHKEQGGSVSEIPKV